MNFFQANQNQDDPSIIGDNQVWKIKLLGHPVTFIQVLLCGENE